MLPPFFGLFDPTLENPISQKDMLLIKVQYGKSASQAAMIPMIIENSGVKLVLHKMSPFSEDTIFQTFLSLFKEICIPPRRIPAR